MKKIKLLLFVLTLLLVFVGCKESSVNDKSDGYDSGDQDGEAEALNEEAAINRKIIYTVSAHISTDDLAGTHKSIKNGLQADEWFDIENVSNGTVQLTIRIKSARLDAFLDSLSSYGEVGNFSKEAKDISLNYENNVNRIASLESELERLNELYEQASINEMITINQRISQVNLEIGKLNGELNRFDSLVDYSVVNLRIYEHKLEKEPTFGSSIGRAFIGGWNAVVDLLKFFVIAISAILPFSIIIVPAGGVVFFALRYKKKKAIRK